MTDNGNGLWRVIAVAAIGMALGMVADTLRQPKDTVNEKEITALRVELGNKIDAQSREISALRQSVNQLATDTAGIAMKVGVSAHPITAPRD